MKAQDSAIEIVKQEVREAEAIRRRQSYDPAVAEAVADVREDGLAKSKLRSRRGGWEA